VKQGISVTADTLSVSINENAEKLILGKHPLTLQWIDWDHAGSVNIVRNDGKIECSGQQISRYNNSDILKIDGTILIVSEKEFILNGIVITKITYINNGKECVRKGSFHFKATQNRQYWRMMEMNNPCDTATDYVDIYFKKI